MANCPKCNAHLKMTDWRPECPKCGVNMVYYGMEDRLLADAEKAETEHAHFQKKIDRLKASTVGGSLQIARLVFGVLPVAGLFLPLAKIVLSDAPYMAAKTISVNILTLVSFFSDYLDVNGLLGVIKSDLVGTSFIMFALSIVMLVLSVVLGLLGFFRLLCSAQKKSCVKNVVISFVQLALIAGSCITFTQFAADINKVFPAFITASLGFGIYILAALHLPTLVTNLIFAKNPMNVKYKELPNYSEQSDEVKAAEATVAAELAKAIEADEKSKKEKEEVTKS